MMQARGRKKREAATEKEEEKPEVWRTGETSGSGGGCSTAGNGKSEGRKRRRERGGGRPLTRADKQTQVLILADALLLSATKRHPTPLTFDLWGTALPPRRKTSLTPVQRLGRGNGIPGNRSNHMACTHMHTHTHTLQVLRRHTAPSAATAPPLPSPPKLPPPPRWKASDPGRESRQAAH